MENKDNKEKIEKLTDQEVQDVAGGAYEGSYADDPQACTHQDQWYIGKNKVVSPPKWPCPKCGSWSVTNIDYSFLMQMRVHCKDCGFFGCRDGSWSV